MKIVFCCSEATPFAKTGGLADVCGALPVELEKYGHEVFLILPRYKYVDEERFSLKLLKDDIWESKIGSNVKIFFIDHKHFYERDDLYGDASGDYSDNFERFFYYCKRTIELLKDLRIAPDVVHCHDWQAALIPVMLKFKYDQDPFYAKTKTIFTIHNMAYQGIFPKDLFGRLGLPDHIFDDNGLEFYDQINLLKGGILFSDRVTTVSPTYSEDILKEPLGCGLSLSLKTRDDRVAGILNGLDVDYWNPQKDPLLEYHFSEENLDNKKKNKDQLQKELGLAVRADVPVFGFVGRLCYQKGFDLLEEVMDEFMKLDVQCVFMGVGEEKYVQFLNRWADQYKEKVAIRLDFEERMAHHIYAASDFLLMPSIYEPCGLSQMIGFRYGAAPIVFETGGLKDTVKDFMIEPNGNGFVFKEYTKEQFLKAVGNALKIFHEEKRHKVLLKNVFNSHFSWEKAAQQYFKVYEQC